LKQVEPAHGIERARTGEQIDLYPFGGHEDLTASE